MLKMHQLQLLKVNVCCIFLYIYDRKVNISLVSMYFFTDK